MTDTISALTRVPGFRAVGVTCGLKVSGNPDLALILSDRPCTAAAVFTTNAFKAAPVIYDLGLLKRSQGILQGVVINAGNANAVTGEQGLADAERMGRLVEGVCELPADSVFVMSTGVIGHRLPMDKIEAGVRQAGQRIRTEEGQQGLNAAQAIMTTDLVPKEAFVQLRLGDQLISLGGIAKGSGMIHPNMATMLSALVTDVAIEQNLLLSALQKATNLSFNRVTVDGDTSTNDTVVILASGQAGNAPIASVQAPEYDLFVAALTGLCTHLAKAIARDGEGATKLVEIIVKGAATGVEAEQAAKTVATSPLMKTALFGNDPNWGRALAAVGRSGATVNPARASLWLGDFELVSQGEPQPFDPIAAHNWLADSKEVKLLIELGVGEAEATVWTCDFSYDYVKINAEYHT